ncbi:MAG: HAMP domain-containing protein [Ignavibacteria bacterium]|nr:HAMP domain-containing protein [Ignavibacteria bacterium]MBI3764948.1 HAMP domain-containing protein [Ignavibacteriales bacterium]
MLEGLKSVRAKLTLWYSFVLLTTLIAFGIGAYTYFSRQLAENLDRSLSNEVKWVKNFIEPKISKVKPSKRFTSRSKTAQPQAQPAPVESSATEPSEADDEIWNQIYEHALLNPKKTLIEVTNKYGAIVFRSFTVGDESLMVGDIPLNTITIQTLQNEKGMDLRVAATTTKELDIYVAYPLSELKEALDNLFSIFLILVPIALAISIGGGWFLAYKSLRPVDEVTKTVQQITAHDLDQQIPERSVNDEIGRLISTFNGMIVRLRHSFEQIKQFSMDASHELRTPLTIMRGEVELALRTPKEPEEYRRVLVSNLEEILRLSAITENLLTLAKAEFGQQDVLYEEEIKLNELIKELYEDTELIALKKHISMKLTKNEELLIFGDRLRLRQLLLNLVDNAIKYTPERGRVTLSSERDDGYAKIQVSDTGIGISPEDQRKIFDRFFRVDKARSRELGGSGLGLSIAKWIAERHKGRIEVRSEPHKGSTFSVLLPL